METNQNLLSADLQIDTTGHAYLAETAKWGKFLSILGFIGSGFIVIAAFFAATILGASDNYGAAGMAAAVGAGTIMVIYLVIGVIYFILSLFLYRFSTKMKVALYSTDQDTLNNALLNLKNLYKMMGIIAVIYLVLMALAIVFGIIGSLVR